MSSTVALVHGFATTSARTWGDNGWLDLLGDVGRTTLPIDLLGHGTADKPHDPAAYEAMESLVSDQLPAEPVDAIGFSLGARVLLTLATDAPERFDRLVLTGVCRSDEHTSELQSLMRISYAVFCLKKKKKRQQYNA